MVGGSRMEKWSKRKCEKMVKMRAKREKEIKTGEKGPETEQTSIWK